ncbi:MAG: cytochrome C oxidase subunit IV family protein [Phycisphaerae bacterium]|nr:cytochrome C oxidase subunit IV family protein [Phycisphaerae bacterium]MDW8262037.1 cytochrome C oxidase subunit IV family protein [Phycisphaerales bacterium]
MSRAQAKYRELVAGAPVETTVAEEHGHGEHEVHAVPVWLLAAVLAVLLVLTVITVLVTLVDLGPLNIVVALGIAVIKSALVVLYFMHLRWDSPFNSIVLLCALLFVAIFLAFAMIDTAEYRPLVDEAVKTIAK